MSLFPARLVFNNATAEVLPEQEPKGRAQIRKVLKGDQVPVMKEAVASLDKTVKGGMSQERQAMRQTAETMGKIAGDMGKLAAEKKPPMPKTPSKTEEARFTSAELEAAERLFDEGIGIGLS